MMDKKDLKKLLAGLTLVALVGGAGLSVSGCAAMNSGSDNQSASSSSGSEEEETFTG